MVDRVYKSDLERLRKTLYTLRAGFIETRPSTDWVKLRVDPLLNHLNQLTNLIRYAESSRPRGVVPMLHSDLVYFRRNVKRLEAVLASERKRSRRRGYVR